LFDQNPVILPSANTTNSMSSLTGNITGGLGSGSGMGMGTGDTNPNRPEFPAASPEFLLNMSKNRELLNKSIATTIRDGVLTHCVVECYSRKRVVTTRSSNPIMSIATVTMSLHIYPVFEKIIDTPLVPSVPSTNTDTSTSTGTDSTPSPSPTNPSPSSPSPSPSSDKQMGNNTSNTNSTSTTNTNTITTPNTKQRVAYVVVHFSNITHPYH